jgi:hypothetical protein
MTKQTSYLNITFNDRTNIRVHDTLRLNLNKGTILR